MFKHSMHASNVTFLAYIDGIDGAHVCIEHYLELHCMRLFLAMFECMYIWYIIYTYI